MLKNKGYPFRNETRCLFKLLLSQWRAEVWWCPERLLGLYTPLPNSNIEQWRMVVVVTGYMLSVRLQYDVTFTFANQRFGEVC